MTKEELADKYEKSKIDKDTGRYKGALDKILPMYSGTDVMKLIIESYMAGYDQGQIDHCDYNSENFY